MSPPGLKNYVFLNYLIKVTRATSIHHVTLVTVKPLKWRGSWRTEAPGEQTHERTWAHPVHLRMFQEEDSQVEVGPEETRSKWALHTLTSQSRKAFLNFMFFITKVSPTWGNIVLLILVAKEYKVKSKLWESLGQVWQFSLHEIPGKY